MHLAHVVFRARTLTKLHSFTICHGYVIFVFECPLHISRTALRNTRPVSIAADTADKRRSRRQEQRRDLKSNTVPSSVLMGSATSASDNCLGGDEVSGLFKLGQYCSSSYTVRNQKNIPTRNNAQVPNIQPLNQRQHTGT